MVLTDAYKMARTERDAELLEYLAAYRELNTTSASPHSEYAFAERLLAEGTFFTYAPYPSTYPKGRMGRCFEDATQLVIDHPDLSYVEGYATGIIPSHHAFGITKDGLVIDPSWSGLAAYMDITDTSYFGIIVDTKKLLRKIARQKRWGYFGVMCDELASERTP
jgi:hypothetical protein